MSGVLKAIVWGGAACAILDGIAACVQFGLKGIKPLRVWQGVASGLLGEPAFRQGWASGGFGLLLHCVIAFSVATVFIEACTQNSPARSSLLDFGGGLRRTRFCGDESGCVAAFRKSEKAFILTSHNPPIDFSCCFRWALPIASAANRFTFPEN